MSPLGFVHVESGQRGAAKRHIKVVLKHLVATMNVMVEWSARRIDAETTATW